MKHKLQHQKPSRPRIASCNKQRCLLSALFSLLILIYGLSQSAAAQDNWAYFPSVTTANLYAAKDDSQQKSEIVQNILSAPLLFEKNEGQVDDRVKYLARSAGGVTYFFTEEGVTMLLTKRETEKETRSDVRITPFGGVMEKWTMNFYNNGVKFATTSFYLKPQIAPGKVPSGDTYNQGTYSTVHYDSICKGPVVNGKTTSVPCVAPYTTPWTIKAKGCYLTAAAMILTYHGVTVDPRSLNTWLNNNKGYDLFGNVDPDKVAQYARDVSDKDFSYRDRIEVRDDAALENRLCMYGPQLIGVNVGSRGPGHWVTATGRDIAKTTFLVNDPDGGGRTTVAEKYAGKWAHIRVFSGPEYVYTDKSSNITIRFYSPGELLLTDPQGRRLGFDPIKGITYKEIPNGSYAGEGLIDDSDPNPDPETDPSYFKEIHIFRPIDGDYHLKVIGTETGTYSLIIRTMDTDFGLSEKNLLYLSIAPNSIHSYSFTYSKAIGSKTKVFGGFDGGGQRPRDVNKFLSFSNPTQVTTELAPGVTTFGLIIFYDKAIVSGSFKAELNKEDISHLFSPSPGGAQVVNLNLVKGRNTLVLSVDGTLASGRIATDSDRLVFIVP